MIPERLTIGTVVLVVLVGLLPIGGLAAVSTNGGTGGSTAANGTTAPTGQQLATVVEITDDEVRTEVETEAFEAELERENESATADALADRAEQLRERAGTIADRKENVSTAFEAGDLTVVAFAQRLSVLNARAENVLESFEDLEENAEDVPDEELQRAGYDRNATQDARERLSGLTGSGVNALAKHYTGKSDGNFELESEAGALSIEVESEDGERSREFERERPGSGSITINESDARRAALEELSDVSGGQWMVTETELEEDEGYYEFEVTLTSPAQTGEATVSVDGQTGSVFELEEEIEAPENADDDEGSDDDRADEESQADRNGRLDIEISNGTAGPGETVSLLVTENGTPVEGATVRIDYQDVGTTDDAGRITVTFPQKSDVAIDASVGDREGERTIEFESEPDEAAGELDVEIVEGSADPGQNVTVGVTANGEPVAGAQVDVESEAAGTTDNEGRIVVTLPDEEEVDIDADTSDRSGRLTITLSDGDSTDDGGTSDDSSDDDSNDDDSTDDDSTDDN
jgi:hypothetical protein